MIIKCIHSVGMIIKCIHFVGMISKCIHYCYLPWYHPKYKLQSYMSLVPCPGNNGVTCKLELQLHIHLILIAKCLNVYLCTPNYIARDAARYRDVENISKVPYALKPVNVDQFVSMSWKMYTSFFHKLVFSCSLPWLQRHIASFVHLTMWDTCLTVLW